MPSANPKLEKQASTEAVEPIRQAIIAIEHKIRNLEKRKGKLESYRDLQKNGKELNHDQKTAVAKYDEVTQTLDFTRDLCKHIVGIANDAAKQQKKLARKEALERTQQDITKVREVLLIQDALANMGTDAVREDFLAGINGAVKLTEDELKFLDDLYGEITVKHQAEEGEPPFMQQVQKAAEHFVAIVDGKQREIVGTTYNKLKEIITSIHQCGYFDQVQHIDEQVEKLVEAVAETQLTEPTVQEPINEDYSSSDRHIPPPESMIPIPNFPVQVASLPVASGPASVPVPGPVPIVQQPIPTPVDSAYYTTASASYAPTPQQPQPQQQPPPQAPRINDVIGTPNFFFLQESELDSPDIASQQQAPIVSHIPPTVNAPIPTQTFTNQNFANPPNVVPQQVMFQHQPPPPQDMPHIAGFANNPNPPPPIPMPPSHQQPNIQYSPPQHPAGFQQQQVPQQNFDQTQQQNFEPTSHQQAMQQLPTEEKTEQVQDEPTGGEPDLEQGNEKLDWSQMTESASADWNQTDPPQQSVPPQQPQQQTSQQAWGDQQRGGYRGRGGRRGNTNGYTVRGRGGGYQQNGRGGGGAGSGNGAGGGQGSYYRNNENSYQNGGYQPRSYNDGTSGFSGGFKRGGGGQRGGSRGERGGMERGGRGGQFRGGQRGGSRGGYAPRGKPQQAQQ